MDTTQRLLKKAAQTGNVNDWTELINRHPLILNNAVAWSEGQTPLHIASMAGHLNIVKEVLKSRKDFTKDLNQHGFSPLHLASANGHVEIVIELLNADSNLCLIEDGKDKWIPLHHATVKGKVDVMRSLLSRPCSADSVEKVTATRETALHLAVKNNQFEAFRLLVEHLKLLNKEHVLNQKDEKGNTILHLAVWRKKREVVDLIVNESGVELNSLNERGLTPLDVLLLFQSEAGDLEIQNILQNAESRRADGIHVQTNPNQVPASNEQSASPRNNQLRATGHVQANRNQVPIASHASNEQSDQLPQEKEIELRNFVLVVAVLMATATYQAALSPPGGVWQEDKDGHKTGMSIMGSNNEAIFTIFMFCNSLGFFTSFFIISVAMFDMPFGWELQIVISAVTVSYYSSIYTIVPSSTMLRQPLGVILIFLSFAIPGLVTLVRNYMKKRRDASGNTNP